MHITTTDQAVAKPQSTRTLIIGALMLIMLLLVAFFANNNYKALHPAALPVGTTTISQSVLEQKYGLRVSLVAVTGGGGFIDLRLKIMDGARAKLLLANPNNFPALFAKNGAMLHAPEDTKAQKIEFITDGTLFIMYPNSANAITQGSPVTIVFGDIALEPIKAQ